MSRFNIQDSIIRTTVSIVALYGLFNLFAGSVFACQRIDCQPRADKVRAELAELKAQFNSMGVSNPTYIYWQYSGNNCSPWTDSNDQYSFFEGDPLCGVLKEAGNNGWTIGVNIHHLVTHTTDTPQLEYLHNQCGVSIVRFWARPSYGALNLVKSAVSAITGAGMSAIPVICDYSNRCDELGISETVQADPTAWYESGYRIRPPGKPQSYLEYARSLRNTLSGAGSVYGIELLNEPHCGGQAGCVTPYSNWARDMVGVLSGFRVGIGQKASENTTRGDSPGVGTPPDFTESNRTVNGVGVGMASAHFYNDAEKALSLQAASQASALGKTFYIGERGLTCDGEGGIAPGGSGGLGGGDVSPVQEPDCSVGPFNLTIKGTVKSSKVFYQTVDEMTGEPIFIDATEQIAGLPYVKNVPVNGAVVQLHDSVKIPGHQFNTGTVDGMLKQAYTTVTTNPDGTFKIEAISHCGSEGNVYRDDWRGRGYEQFLTISCADKLIGEASPRMVVKDVFGFILDKKGTGDEVTLNLEDFNVDCQAVPWKTYPGVSKPSGDLKVAKASKEVFAACSGTKRIASDGNPGVTYPKRKSNTDLIFKDSWDRSFLGFLADLGNWISGLFGGECGTDDSGCWGDWLEAHTPFQGRTEGRDDINTQLFDLSEHAAMINLMLGIKDSVAKVPLYFLNGAPATYSGREIETYNGHEEKPQLPDCGYFLRCSQTLSEPDHPLDNMQTCGGMAMMLGTPYGNIIRADDGVNIDPYLSGDAARYSELPKTREVCVDKTGGSETVVTVADIMPPEGYCGDVIIVNNEIDVPLERPCPSHFSCGDYNGNGTDTDPGERPCSSLKLQNANNAGRYDMPNTLYKYDIRYFPYDMLYNLETKDYAQAESHTKRTKDSYDNVCPHGDLAHGGDGQGYNASEGSGGQSKPANSICEDVPGSYTFYQQVETKTPCTGSVCYKKNEAVQKSEDGKIPPVAILWTPQFADTSDSRAFVAQAVAGAEQTITATRKGNPYRVGVPDNLCSCSLVENGTNADLTKPLANCLTDAALGQVPKANEPANISDPTKDQVVGGDSQIAPYVTYASPVMGGYDYELEKKALATEGSSQEIHYDQSTTGFSVSKAVSDMLDTVACRKDDDAVEGDPEHNPDGYDFRRDITCGRVLRKTAESTLMVRGTMPPLASLGYSLLHTLNAPFTDQVKILMAGKVNATKTKLELKEDGNKYGFDLSKWSADEVPGSQESGDSIYRGYSKEKDISDLSNSVSTPIWGGQETPACRMVPGWQVSDFEDGTIFTVDCLDDGRCWAGGSAKNDNWSDSRRLIVASSDRGVSWGGNLTPGSGFVHGINAYESLQLGAGQFGRTFYSTGSGGWTDVRALIEYGGNDLPFTYGGYAYDIAGTPSRGYITTATGYVFYSPDGKSGWKDIYKEDDFSGQGCEARDYPYNCKPLSDEEVKRPDKTVPPVCSPNCCCFKYSADPNVDADGDPFTPNCPIAAQASGVSPSCWLWGSSSIWGVDCNETTGDCFIAGQKSAKAWYGKNTGSGALGKYENWTRYYLNQNGHAMDVSFPSDKAVYIVGGSDDDPYNTRNLNKDGQPQISKNGWILKTVPGSGNWETLTTLPEAGFFGIDCYDELNCAVAGNFGTVLITADGGATWKNWADPLFSWAGDPVIEETFGSDKIHFWDIAYPNQNTLVVAGFKVDEGGVIYALGEREDCDEPEPEPGDGGG